MFLSMGPTNLVFTSSCNPQEEAGCGGGEAASERRTGCRSVHVSKKKGSPQEWNGMEWNGQGRTTDAEGEMLNAGKGLDVCLPDTTCCWEVLFSNRLTGLVPVVVSFVFAVV